MSRSPKDILEQAIELQVKKGQDYQNKNSTIRQADYYPRGVETIIDTMNGKLLRIRSVVEAIKNGESQNFESIQDSCVDLINYSSFLASYIEGGIDGQHQDRDMFNQPRCVKLNFTE
jgi:hypothetical protein